MLFQQYGDFMNEETENTLKAIEESNIKIAFLKECIIIQEKAMKK